MGAITCRCRSQAAAINKPMPEPKVGRLYKRKAPTVNCVEFQHQSFISFGSRTHDMLMQANCNEREREREKYTIKVGAIAK